VVQGGFGGCLEGAVVGAEGFTETLRSKENNKNEINERSVIKRISLQKQPHHAGANLGKQKELRVGAGECPKGSGRDTNL